MKFIHFADVHLGAAPDAGRPWGARREKELWQCFRAVIRVAKQEQTDLLLIAGDLFHRQPLKRELKEVAAILEEIPDTQVVLIAGNHDYLHPKSYYRTFGWPKHVHMIRSRDLTPLYLPGLNVTVWGSSYWGKEDGTRLYDAAPPFGSGYQILLGHGGDERHRPFSVSQISRAGYDYAAFGHVHIPERLRTHQVIMAGALQPVEQNDLGSHGYWMGQLTPGGCRVQFYPVRVCEYRLREVDVTPEMTSGQMLQKAEESLWDREAYEISHVILKGLRDGQMEPPLEELAALSRVVKVVDETRADYRFDELKVQYRGTLVEAFIREMECCPDPGIREQALYLGVQAMLDAMES